MTTSQKAIFSMTYSKQKHQFMEMMILSPNYPPKQTFFLVSIFSILPELRWPNFVVISKNLILLTVEFLESSLLLLQLQFLSPCTGCLTIYLKLDTSLIFSKLAILQPFRNALALNPTRQCTVQLLFSLLCLKSWNLLFTEDF